MDSLTEMGFNIPFWIRGNDEEQKLTGCEKKSSYELRVCTPLSIEWEFCNVLNGNGGLILCFQINSSKEPYLWAQYSG